MRVRRLNEQDWLGHFELGADGLDYAGITDPGLAAELKQAFEQHPSLTAATLEIGRFPWFNDTWRVIEVRRETPMWLAMACTMVLFSEYGIVSDYDMSDLEGWQERDTRM